MKQLSILALMVTMMACLQETDRQPPSSIDFLKKLNYRPKMVGPNVISTSHFEGHASITPSGEEIYYAIYSNDHRYSTIAYATKMTNTWQAPKIAPFSGKYSDGSPALSPDGNSLFFSSKRPINQDTQINSSNDIWVVRRAKDKPWGKPTRLREGINTAFNEFSPSVDQSGNLYFCSDRPEGFGSMDIYFAAYVNEEYQQPVLLDSTINSKYQEGNVGVSPDGTILFLMIQHLPGDYGYDDIHYSIKQANGKWQKARNVGPIINTYTYDFSPKISPDGRRLYFSSRISPDFGAKDTAYSFQTFDSQLKSPLNGFGNIYQIDLDQLNLLTNE